MFEARWNDSDHIKGAADTMKEAAGVVLSLTSGDGDIYIYEVGKPEVIKVFKIRS
jgi:hypothetical protein